MSTTTRTQPVPDPSARRGRRLLRATLLALVMTVVTGASPSHAQLAPAPTVRDFDDQSTAARIDELYPGSDLFITDNDLCGDVIVSSGARSPEQVLAGICPALRVRFSEPQAMVGLFVRPIEGVELITLEGWRNEESGPEFRAQVEAPSAS
jgi:hypothetical protein